MWTAGNGITFAEGREDNTVTLDNGLPANRNRPCQAVSTSLLSCTTQTNTNLPPHHHHFFPFHHMRRLLFSTRPPACRWHTYARRIWQGAINTLLPLRPSLFTPRLRLWPVLVEKTSGGLLDLRMVLDTAKRFSLRFAWPYCHAVIHYGFVNDWFKKEPSVPRWQDCCCFEMTN